MLVYVPALWALSGITVLLVGLAPRRSTWIWALYGFTFIIMMYGRMIPDLEFLVRITPIGWVPQLPVDEINWPTMAILSAISIALTALGITFYNKRDINVVS
jgi:ABC-2 type transport system permease protein